MAFYIDNVEFAEEEYYANREEVKAAAAARAVKISEYLQKIAEGVITLADVPAEYYDEVYYIVNPPEPEATEADYQEALAEMGVKLDEEE